MRQVRRKSDPVPGTNFAERATRADSAKFSFLRDTKGTLENIKYRLADIYNTGPKWFVYYFFLSPETGKMKRIKVYEGLNRIADLSKRQAHAEVIRDSINKMLKSGFDPFAPVEPPAKVWTFSMALGHYKTYLEGDNDLRKKTIQGYMSAINILYEFPFKSYPLVEITEDQLVSFFSQLKQKKKWTNRTYNGYVGFAKTWLAWLKGKKIIKENVLDLVKRRKTLPKKHKAYSKDEAELIFKTLRVQADSSLYWYCKFVYYTGTRPKSETRLLQLRHIDYDRQLLYIPAEISKNKKGDYIPLAKELFDWLLLFKDLPKDYYIFSLGGPGPEPFGQNTMATRFKEVRDKLKLDTDHTIYGFKHTRAIDLAQTNIDPYEIMRLFRHSGLDITMKYLRDLGILVKRDAVNVLK